MSASSVLVIGGYGYFGSRLVERLARNPSLRVLVAGRSGEQARRLVDRLRPGSRAVLEAVTLDARAASLEARLRALTPRVVIDASGPFQGNDYRVPLACIAAGCHHVDLADARAYVTGIGALDDAARAAGVFVTSGASSVPALSSAAADRLAAGLRQVHAIDIGISPGNRTERGLSTVQATLSYCGKELPGGAFGWCGTRSHRYPAPVGSRLLSPCDIPDLTLLPLRYAGLPAVRFSAGLELRPLHRGMNVLAWLVRAGIVRDASRHARVLKALSDPFRHVGSDAGAMHVAVTGVDAHGRRLARTWQLVASCGDGPYVPTLAAAALVRKLAAGELAPGARPCVGLLTLGDFERELQGLRITMETDA